MAAHLDALAEAHEVRRGVKASAEPGRPVHAFEEGTGRSLAVGPGDMDEAQAFLRMARRRRQTPGGIQSGLEPELAQLEQVGECLGRGHGKQRLQVDPRSGGGRMQGRVHHGLGLGTVMEGDAAWALFPDGVDEFHCLIVAEGHQRIAHPGIAR